MGGSRRKQQEARSRRGAVGPGRKRAAGRGRIAVSAEEGEEGDGEGGGGRTASGLVVLNIHQPHYDEVRNTLTFQNVIL